MAANNKIIWTCFWPANFSNAALGQGVKTWKAVWSDRDLHGSALTWGEDHSLLPSTELGSSSAQHMATTQTSRKGTVATTASAQAKSDMPGAIQGFWRLWCFRSKGSTCCSLQHQSGGCIQTRADFRRLRNWSQWRTVKDLETQVCPVKGASSTHTCSSTCLYTHLGFNPYINFLCSLVHVEK